MASVPNTPTHKITVGGASPVLRGLFGNLTARIAATAPHVAPRRNLAAIPRKGKNPRHDIHYRVLPHSRKRPRATLDRITHFVSDLDSAKVKAKSLFETLNLPQTPDDLRIFGWKRTRGVLLDTRDRQLLDENDDRCPKKLDLPLRSAAAIS
jgi:hypothetical protein